MILSISALVQSLKCLAVLSEACPVVSIKDSLAHLQ